MFENIDGESNGGFRECSVVKQQFDKCYLFEPDKDCANIIKKRIAEEWRTDRIYLFEKGAWNTETELFFDTDPEYGASHITDNAITKIKTATIDDTVNTHVSYIKMDIEGAELKALMGAKNTIIKYKPKLAICVYHNMEDFLSIPEWLHNIVPDYKFYLRHHNWGAMETVLYAKI